MDSYSLDHVFSQALLSARYLRAHRYSALLTREPARRPLRPLVGGHISQCGSTATHYSQVERPLHVAVFTSALPLLRARGCDYATVSP